MPTVKKKQDIPDGWQVKTLGDVGRVSMCKRILKSQTSDVGDIPFFKIGTFGKEPDAYISSKVYEEFKSKYSFPNKGDVLISASGTIGRTVVYDGSPAYFQDSNIIWIANDERTVLNPYLRYLYDKVQWQTASGTIARLYNDNVRRIEIVAPEVPEQKRIVKVLETWDRAIEKLGQMIELKREVKRGLMQKLLTGELRLPGFTNDWRKVVFNQVGTFSKGKGIAKSQLFQSGNNAVRYGELYTKHHYSIKKIYSFISDEVASESQRINRGDILIAGSGETIEDIGKSAAYLSSEPAYAGGDIIVFTPKKEDSRFLGYFLNFGQVRKQMREIGEGQSVVHIYKSDIEKLSFEIPEPIEQKEIGEIIFCSEQEIDLLIQKRNFLLNQKKYLLNNLVTGQIRTPENL